MKSCNKYCFIKYYELGHTRRLSIKLHVYLVLFTFKYPTKLARWYKNSVLQKLEVIKHTGFQKKLCRNV